MSFQWSLDDRSIGEGFRRIAREQIEKAIAIAHDAAETPASRVHEARRRAKKLRALLRLVRPDFGQYERENAFVRDAARGLAAARDVKVAEETLADLLRWAGREPPTPRPAEEDAGEQDGLATFGAQMNELLARTEKWKTGKIDLDTLAEGLTDTYRRGLEAMELVGDRPSDAAFHEWRKHAKYHWNQLGLLEAAAQHILPAAHKAVGELADLLGKHHDLAVLIGMIRGDAVQFANIDRDFVLDAAGRRQAGLETEIGALGRQVYAETPKALHARFRSYLGGWRAQESSKVAAE